MMDVDCIYLLFFSSFFFLAIRSSLKILQMARMLNNCWIWLDWHHINLNKDLSLKEKC